MIALHVQNVSKRYRLGVVNRDMLYKDLQSRWAKFRGKEDPNAQIGLKHDKRLEHGDEFWALRNVDLEVKEGEILGIIGPNGAGKSTLLKILSQITAPTEGKIKVKGRIASLLEVGTGFHPELTGRENVYLNGAILGMTRKEVTSKFDEIVSFADISQFIDTPVKRYSSGMYVRLAFSVAAHLEPEILIVDEVLAVGDAEFQKKCISKMGDVANAGRTVLFVSHQIPTVRSLCTKAVWIDEGSVRDTGCPESITDAYLENASSIQELGPRLEKTQSRGGTGVVRVCDFRCYNSSGEETYKFRSGQACFVEVKVKSSVPTLQKGVSASVDVHDSIGNRMLLFHTKLVNSDFEIGGEGKSIVFRIPELPLAPGMFSLSLYIGKDNYETFQYVDNIASFEVQEGDFYGGGHPGYPTHCKILTTFSVDVYTSIQNELTSSNVQRLKSI
jgi:lipopolysaccharide transport system ATP-binding protein